MRIATIGAGNVGGGLATLWEGAGHDLQRVASEGGDVSAADVVLLAVPYAAIADALGKARGVVGKPVIDATNTPSGERPSGFSSLAEYVKSLTGGPVAKAFNTNFARLYGRTGDAGPIENARGLEDFLRVEFAISSEMGQFFYRMAPPESF